MCSQSVSAAGSCVYCTHVASHLFWSLICYHSNQMTVSVNTNLYREGRQGCREKDAHHKLFVSWGSTELAFSLKMDWIYFNQVYLQFRWTSDGIITSIVHMLKTTSAICTDGLRLWRSVLHLQGRIDIIVKLSCGCRVGSWGSIAKYLAECQLILDLNCKKEECSSQTHTGAPV